MRNRKKWIDLAGSIFIAWALGASLSMTVVGALGLHVGFGAACWPCGAAAVIGALLVASKRTALLGAALAVALAAVCVFSPIRAFEQVRALIGEAANAGESPALAHADLIAALVGMALTGILFWMSRVSGGVYPALTLSLAVMLGGWFMENRIDPLCAVLAVASLLTMFARAADEKTPYLRALPAALLAALIALWLLPAGNVTWAPLRDLAEQARSLFQDYFAFTDARTTYSISADGFQPMGEALGGPVDPNLNEVMAVETDDTLLLRGSIKRTYTTYSWTESAVNSRYVFIDPLRKSLRDQIFDANRLGGLKGDSAFKRARVPITMLGTGISALYVPHRLTDLDIALNTAAYFSTSGEVFLTRGVEYGDTYTVTADIQTDDEDALRALITDASRREDGAYRSVAENYTQLPRGIERGVYSLTERLVKGLDAPIDRALAIERYLANSYTYSLEVGYPPSGRDFVSYFLLDSKEGYCSYFASAMAVMCRIAGLPTRYIEGYLAPARDDGVTVVTGKNAHAWVEAYFSGVGWVAFNPTPGSGDDYSPSGDTGGQGADGPAGGDAAEGEDGEPEPTPSPEPTDAPPADEPGGESADEPGADAQGDSSQDNSAENDSPESESPDETPPEDDPSADEPDDRPDFPWWALILALALAALIFLIAKRLYDTDPNRVAGRSAPSPDRLMIWYRAILLVLEQQGQTPAPGETPALFAARLKEAGLAGDALCFVAEQVSLSSYARQKPDATVYRQARAAYAQLAGQLKWAERARWIVHRLTRGLGDIRRIP